MESNRLVFFDTRLGVEDQDFFRLGKPKNSPKNENRVEGL